MYLKSIEMQGFKSFANRMSFEFRQGITGIVGPNGSGKSNVADAVRWVLGEQSAKQLRGGNMQDVIFAGTEARKPQSFASVAITFDNSDHALDIAFEEVTVTRRLYRSGESEYRINNASVRLRDIQELFYDTGIGKEGYSIIGQGQIEKILSGKADERRELFDEAAGIVKFKRRKNMSLKKLADEQQNLLRVTDILRELSSQLEPLKKQSENAKIYLDKRETLKNLEVNVYLIETEKIRKELSELSEKITITDGDMEEAKKEFDEIRGEYDEVVAKIERLEGELSELSAKMSQDQVLREQLRGQVSLYTEQIRAMQKASRERGARKETITADRLARREELRSCREDLGKLSEDLRASEKGIAEETEKLTALDGQIAEENTRAASVREEIFRELDARAKVQGEQQRFETMLEQIGIRRSEIDARLLRFKEEDGGAKEQSEKAQAELVKIREKISELASLSSAAEQRVNALQNVIHTLDRTLDADQVAYHREASRLESLKTLAEHYEGYGGGIQKVMEQRKKNPGIHGVVADLLETDAKYETAIETALGGSIRNIVTDNDTTAKYLIEYLKAGKLGRATFLPLTNVRSRGRFEPANALREAGVIGLASELVHCEPIYEDLKSQLLGRTLVVDNIDNALSLGRKYRHSLYIVTLAGESFSPGGSITGGAFRNKENLLGRKREIEEMTGKVRALKKKLEDTQKEAEAKRRERNGYRDRIVLLGGQLQEQYLLENTAEMRRKQAEEQLRLSRISRSSLDEETVGIQNEIEKAKENSSAIEKKLEDSKKHEEALVAKAAEREAAIRELSKAREQQAAVVENLRVGGAALAQKDTFLRESEERLLREIEALDREEESLQAAMLSEGDEEEEKRRNIAAVEETIRASEEIGKTDAAREETLRREKEALGKSRENFFNRRESVQDRVLALDRESVRLHTRKEKLEESTESSKDYLWNEYELTPSEAMKLRDETLSELTAVRREAANVRAAIKRLGNVNVNAIEEYKEVSERHAFLTGQYNDLVESEKTLEGIIAELDRGMRRQFAEKFKEINAAFDTTFQTLFGGGRGKLVIEEEGDILEAAISIIAEPPGKKLQNMMQLSGGEKSLTAIALLFAIQSLKPSPFALLDEIEAALDDSNVVRFAEYLHKLTENTQFIVITHRRGTMNAADRLYGITMQEKGVSAMVSVNLVEDSIK